ncbi:MAG TPA: hypothetical protein VGP47_00950 [Parachlamydiaceae bacterium]|nr:hypothetical protein [Parachlamydiaceae bacterium]
MDKIYRDSVGEGVSILEDADNPKQLLVTRFYQLPITNATTFSVNEIEINTFIKLALIAGRIGYGKPEISVKIEKFRMRQ